MKKTYALIALSTLFASRAASAKIYIDITETSKNPFSIALVDSVTKTEKDKTHNAGDTFTKTLQKDLEFISLFKFIDSSAYLEAANRKFANKDIDFAKWAVLDTMGLVKSWYSVEGDKLTVEAHLYDVLSRSEIVAKKYQASTDQAASMAHSFADAILKALIGTEGLFKSKIAYVCSPNKEKDLCTVALDGSKDQLTHGGGIVRSPAWNNSGTSIYYTWQKPRQNAQPYRLDLDRRSANPVGSIMGTFIGMSVSPRGTLLAALTKDGNAELYELSSTAVPQQRLTTSLDIDVSGRYSKDGQKIVFVSDRGSGTQIYSMNSDGSGVKPLTFKGKRNESPVFSPKGDKILFAGMDTDRHYDIFSMDADGSNLIRLTSDSGDNESPSWSPGGELIVYSSNKTGQYQLWTMRPDGSNQKQLTFDNWEHKMPVWGPNQ